MTWFVIALAALHGLFMMCELFPWSSPVLLRLISRRLPKHQEWTAAQGALVATIVHNAGIYNAILAGGLLSAVFRHHPGGDVTRVMCAGAAVAGIFGTVTLKSPLTALQALLGFIGLVLT
jgi:uncharacterized membrane protein